MVFSSLVFLCIFLPIVLILHSAIKNRKAQNGLLLAASLLFYAYGEPVYVALMLASALYNYLFAIWLSKSRNSFIVALAAAVNVGVLCVFKYAGFLLTNLNTLLGLSLPIPEIPLPIGISFFTFQGMSYVIDVYRGRAAVQKNPLLVGLYIALFPQLVAGPIVRYTDIAQALTRRDSSLQEIAQGLIRFMLGFGKKMLLANAMGEVADRAFAHVGTALLTTPLAWVGAVAYTFQIYFDFSAYSDMAIGLGRVFGFAFGENFNYPYMARSVTDFWRRWHISLSSWFRDYVYIPLGGNRCSRMRNVFNLAVVWLLTGLWHGAAWSFLVWGAYYGLLLIEEKYVLSGVLDRCSGVLCHGFTMLVVIVGWVFFRANSLADAVIYLSAMLGGGGSDGTEAVYCLLEYWPEFLGCVVGCFPIKQALSEWLSKRNAGAGRKLVLPALLALCVFALSYISLISGSFNPFIYFQF